MDSIYTHIYDDAHRNCSYFGCRRAVLDFFAHAFATAAMMSSISVCCCMQRILNGTRAFYEVSNFEIP